ncbi:MAG: hypothetical protein KH437_09045 [Prevotella sp.]|nr:hypothetical protein [Prevotella sp.]
MIAQIAAAAYFGYKQCKLSERRHWSPFNLFLDARASASTEASAKEQEAPSSKAEQLEKPQAKPSEAVLEERIVQAVIDKLWQHKDPQIINNFFGGNHIVAPNAQEAYQQFHYSSKLQKD